MGKWLDFVTSGFAGPACIAVTIVGIVLSVLVWRKKGARSGIRGIAWSLLPLAAYLTHALGLIGRVVSAIVQFAASFVFSPETWLGVILVGVSAVLFLVSGGIPLVGWRKRHKAVKDQPREDGQPTASLERARGKSAIKAEAEDELADVRDILKKHGIS